MGVSFGKLENYVDEKEPPRKGRPKNPSKDPLFENNLFDSQKGWGYLTVPKREKTAYSTNTTPYTL